MSDAPPRVLAILPGFTASTLLDVVQPMLALQQEGKIVFTAKLEFYTTLRDLDLVDLVIFCRNAEPRYVSLLDGVCSLQIPYIYDLDDNLFEVPVDTSLGQYYHAPERKALMKRYLNEASLVRVYSNNMLDIVKELDARAELVTVPLIWSYYELPADPTPHSQVRLVYATSRNEDQLFDICLPAVQQVLIEYPDRVEVYFWGFLPKALKGHRNVHYLAPIRNYRTFSREFKKKGFDIGLAPLVVDLFHRSKTNNKFREYSACGIAGIYSDVEVYSDCVQNGENGLLVSNDPEAWHDAIVRLIEDAGLRKSISKNALEFSRRHYSEELFRQTWLDQIIKVMAIKPNPAQPAGGARNPDGSPPDVNHGSFLNKFDIVFDRLRRESPLNLIKYFQYMLQNLWLQFKINRLKKL